MQILLVEDDVQLAQSLKTALVQHEFVVNHVETGEAALYIIKTEVPDIVLLDLGLPDIDGLDVLQAARKLHDHLPILLLTARDSVSDKVKGLDGGADDYLSKPFEIDELLARLRVLQRRISNVNSAILTIKNVSLDTEQHSVYVDNQLVDLSRREYMLIKTLIEHAGRVQARSVLEARLYSWEEEVSSNALEVHIHNLRKKLGSDFITTIRGIGYRVAKE